MFKSLREKLGGWFKKNPEEVAEEPKKDTKKEVKKKPEKKVTKKEKTAKKEKVVEKEVKKKEEKPVEDVLKEKADKIKEEVPVRFEVGLQKHIPDVEAVEGKLEELEKVEETLEDIQESKNVGFEEVKEEVKAPKKDELGFFGKLKKKLSTSELKQGEFDEIFEDLEFILLENNVALGVVDKIKVELGKDLVGISVKKGNVEKTIKESLIGAIDSVLIEGEDLIKEIEKSLEPVYVVLFFGINGSGKTTSVAKLAHKLKEKGISSVLAAGDTFRAASIEQLETHAKKIGVPIVKGEYGGDPASVAFDAISYAKKNKIKTVLIDTAGRMYTKTNLMKEMEKIVRVAKANKKIFVGESITGNDATEQAKMFNETAGIDGVILTKADVDEKAGAILSVSHATGKPILYLGVGQEYSDLKEFKKEDVIKNLGLD